MMKGLEDSRMDIDRESKLFNFWLLQTPSTAAATKSMPADFFYHARAVGHAD
jgi:hypothetical protein